MAWNATQWVAVMVHAAPMLGIPVWLVLLQLPSNSWNFPLLFALGLFMLVGGLAVPLVVWLSSAQPTPPAEALRAEARSALQFHGAIVILGLLVCVAFVIATQFDPPNLTMATPPVYTEGVLMVGAVLFGAILPVAELARAIVCGLGAWREFVKFVK